MIENIKNWIWRKFWYRISWWKHERDFVEWVKWGKSHFAFIKFDSWEELHRWENEMLEKYDSKKRRSVLNIFRPYHKWN